MQPLDATPLGLMSTTKPEQLRSDVVAMLGCRVVLNLSLMKRPAAKERATQRSASRLAHRASGPSRNYLKTRVRGQRLYEAAFILAIVELTRRLHQAYPQAYDKQAVEWLLPQNTLTANQKEFVLNAMTRASTLLDNDRCANFINALVQRAAEVAGRAGAYVSTNGSFGFDKATAQWLYYDAINKGRVTASGKSGISGTNTTYGTTDPNNSHRVSWNNEFFGLSADEAALHSLHEALHQIRYFDDQTLAGAASFVDSHGQRQTSYAEGAAGVDPASRDLNTYIRRYCSP